MSSNVIDLNNLAAIIRELKDVVEGLSPEELETLEVLLDDEAMVVLDLPSGELVFHDFENVRPELENPGK